MQQEKNPKSKCLKCGPDGKSVGLFNFLEYYIFQDDLAKFTELQRRKKNAWAQLHNHWIMHSKWTCYYCMCVYVPPSHPNSQHGGLSVLWPSTLSQSNGCMKHPTVGGCIACVCVWESVCTEKEGEGCGGGFLPVEIMLLISQWAL